MVATLVRLKLRLLLNAYQREVWRVVVLVLGGLYGLSMLAVLVLAMQQLAEGEVATRQLVVVGAGSALVLAWAVVPVLAFGVDDTLDPQRFTLFTVPSARLALGLVLAGAIGVPGVLTVLGAQLPVLLWLPGPRAAAASAVAVLGGLLGAATCLLLARVTTTAAAATLRSRRGRDAAALVGLLLLVPMGLVPLLGPQAGFAWLPQVLAVLAWTPLGSPWAAPGDVAAGAAGAAALRLLLSALTLAVLALAWQRLLAGSMVTVATGAVRRRGPRSRPLAVVDRLAQLVPGPAAAVAARSARYWRTDPRYLSNAIGMAVAVGVLTVVFLGLGPGVWWGPMVVAPVLAGFAAWTPHNDTAWDSTAFWMHVSAGVSGRDDRLGRVLGAASWMLPLVLVVAVAGVAWAGAWQLLPATLGASLGVLGAGLAVSALASALVVYPAQPPGSSPFSSSGLGGSVLVTLLAQGLTSLAALALALPVLVLTVLAFAVAPWWGWVALAVGAAGGAGLVAAGVVLGGRTLERRAPRLLATMGGWPRH